MSEQPTATQWCLVGNIVEHRRAGVEGGFQKNGAPHFSGGTKVYSFPARWGDGYENTVVVGRHRGSKRFVRMVIPSAWITNWRAQVVYSPAVLGLITEYCALGHPNWKSKEEVETFVQFLQPRAA